MHGLLRTEGPRTAGAVLAGLIVGWLIGFPVWGLLGAVSGLLGFHLWQASRLLAWSQAPKKYELPSGSGIWEEVFNSAYTRYKQARKRKKRLAGMLSEFRASTGALPDAAVVLDATGQIAWYNNAAGSMLGFRASKDLGQRVSNLLRHPTFNRYFCSEDADRNGVEMPSPVDSESTLWVRLIPYGQNQILLIARDITDVKRLEQTRRDFVANASHELRTPLTVVRGYLDMMGEESADGGPLAPWQAPLKEMRRQAARMQQIIADLLKLANLEASSSPNNVESVDMPSLLRAALEELEALSGGEHRVSAEIVDGLHVTGSQSELYSVITNLLSNALRYTPPGGEVTVSWRESGSRAVLIVHDSGIGIAARDIPRLTERFYRADVARSRETGGTGLGLAIVKHALERHEARLHIESQVGKGSTFRCEFPARRVIRTAALAKAS